MEKILIPRLGQDLAPRFDLAPEVLLVSVTRETSAMGRIAERTITLDSPSGEAMYRLVMAENVNTILCAGMEKEIYDFLKRKSIKVVDNVCGPVEIILETYLIGKLSSGQDFFNPVKMS